MDRPLIPPPEFVTRVNTNSGGPYRSALDPLMMLLWHQASAPLPSPVTPVTGAEGT